MRRHSRVASLSSLLSKLTGAVFLRPLDALEPMLQSLCPFLSLGDILVTVGIPLLTSSNLHLEDVPLPVGCQIMACGSDAMIPSPHTKSCDLHRDDSALPQIPSASSGIPRAPRRTVTPRGLDDGNGNNRGDAASDAPVQVNPSTSDASRSFSVNSLLHVPSPQQHPPLARRRGAGAPQGAWGLRWFNSFDNHFDGAEERNKTVACTALDPAGPRPRSSVLGIEALGKHFKARSATVSGTPAQFSTAGRERVPPDSLPLLATEAEPAAPRALVPRGIHRLPSRAGALLAFVALVAFRGDAFPIPNIRLAPAPRRDPNRSAHARPRSPPPPRSIPTFLSPFSFSSVEIVHPSGGLSISPSPLRTKRKRDAASIKRLLRVRGSEGRESKIVRAKIKIATKRDERSFSPLAARRPVARRTHSRLGRKLPTRS